MTDLALRSPAPASRRGSARRFHGIALACLALLGVGLYAPGLGGPFALDDHRNIVENHALRLPALDLAHLAHAALDSPSPRPVANVSFALNYYLAGEHARGYRVVNVAIHVLNAWLVYALCLALCRARSSHGDAAFATDRDARLVALLAALVFVAHPIQTQAVTYVIQRMTSLCTAFYLGALLLYLTGRSRASLRGRVACYAAAGTAWALALATKQIAVTLPLAAFLVEWFFLRDLSRAWLRRNAPRLLAAAVCGVLVAGAYAALVPGVLDYSGRDFTMLERVLTQLRVVVFYISLLVLPLPGRLNLTHGFATSHGLLDPPTTALCLAGLLLLLGFALSVARRQRIVSFCILWFFLQLALESSVIPLEMVFEHRLYLPLVGVSLLAALGMARLAARSPALGWGLAVAVIAALAAGTLERNLVWSDPVSLWSDVVAKAPGDQRARNNLGNALSRRSRFDEAIVQYRETLRLNAGHVQARTNLALALEMAGSEDAAWLEAERAARMDPSYPRARYILGNMYARHGRFAEAVPHLEAAARLDAGHAEARFELGGALIRLGRFEQARAALEDAVAIDPTSARTHAALGGVHAQLGDRERARAHLSEALRLEPDLVAARQVMARLDDAAPRRRARPERIP